VFSRRGTACVKPKRLVLRHRPTSDRGNYNTVKVHATARATRYAADDYDNRVRTAYLRRIDGIVILWNFAQECYYFSTPRLSCIVL